MEQDASHTCEEDRELKGICNIFVTRTSQFLNTSYPSLPSESNTTVLTAMATSTSHDDAASQGQGQLLQCPLCHNNYDEAKHMAKLLACHHSFCATCLTSLMNTEKSNLKCPVCRKKTSVTENGINGLQNNFYVSQMRDMMEVPKIDTKACQKHNNQPLLFFCDTCTVPICMNCTVLDHDKSLGHSIRDISAAVSVHQELLQAKVAKAEESIQHRHQHLAHLKIEMRNLDVVKATATERLTATFSQLKAKLEEREKHLMEKVQESYEARKSELIEKAQNLKVDMTQLHTIMESYKAVIDEGNAVSIITAATDGESMSHMDEINQNLGHSLPRDGFIEFDHNAGLKNFRDCVNKLGSVKIKRALPSVVVVQECEAIASNSAIFCVTLHSCSGQPLDGYPITLDITDPCKDTIPNKIQSENNGVYTVSFLPQMPGNHTIKVNFLGELIFGTEQILRVHSNNPILKIGEEGKGDGQLYHPTSVAVSPSLNIYVADMGNKRIQVFNKKGKYMKQFKVGASKSTTYDIAINPATEEMICTKVAPSVEGTMLADSVRFFGLGGEKLRQFIHKGMVNGLFIAVNSKGRIIITDASENCVYIFSKDGSVLKKFGTPGSKPGQFNFPAAVCVGKEDTIFISDTKNHRVQVFSNDGKFSHQFGCQGNKKGQFYLPRGIAADQSGNVLVADSHNKIQVFKYDGTFVSCIDSREDPVNDPYNLTIAAEGQVFVADFKNNCVKKYLYL